MQNMRDSERCVHIRWKGMYIDTVWDRDAGQQGTDHIYWCHKTQMCLGPDGKCVDQYECHEGRGCYKDL